MIVVVMVIFCLTQSTVQKEQATPNGSLTFVDLDLGAARRATTSILRTLLRCSPPAVQGFVVTAKRAMHSTVRLGRLGSKTRKKQQVVKLLKETASQVADASTASEKEPLQIAASEFFLFISNYGWSLRYQINRLAESALNLQHPLKMEWVKLRQQVSDHDLLIKMNNEDLFDLSMTSEVKYNGYFYEVMNSTRNDATHMEVVINLLQGRGVSILVDLQEGIRLLDRSVSNAANQAEQYVRPLNVTHCWVQMGGMANTVLKSVSFYDKQDVVSQWSA